MTAEAQCELHSVNCFLTKLNRNILTHLHTHNYTSQCNTFNMCPKMTSFQLNLQDRKELREKAMTMRNPAGTCKVC